MSEPKDHHFVQRAYLEAWCDPRTPHGQDPYVWLFPKDGSEPSRKAPKKIFYKRHLYSEALADGEKDTSLEASFNLVESAFVRARALILERASLDDDAMAALHLYTAVQMQRVPVWQDRIREPLSDVLSLAKEIRLHAAQMTPDERRAAAMVARLSLGRGDSEEAVRRAHDYPFHSIMWPVAVSIAAFLCERKSLLIAFAPAGRSFITTDNPCIQLDLATNREPGGLGTPGLIDPDVAVLFPLAPECAAFFHNRNPPGRAYGTVPGFQVDHWNGMLAASAPTSYVFHSETVPGLLDPEPFPAEMLARPER